MGTDNLFHKRKARSSQSLKRRQAKREAYKKILIVCEGEKTEPNYFEDVREHYQLNTVNVEVRGDCGSDPVSIIKFAKQRYREERDAGDPFDKVYCLFDKDDHAKYLSALAEVDSAVPKNTFFAINSVPCFEYWLLLHFTYSTRPYQSVPGNSAGNQILRELKDYMPDYEKGSGGVFTQLLGQLERAKSFAERSLQESIRNKTDNPCTRVHHLVSDLQSLKA
ncbi:MAG: RloB family protein [Gammaproteobacteria bacterium]|nr:RloB family protein [Gammaproteobacteria bacterium]